jgi:hypothetical protein
LRPARRNGLLEKVEKPILVDCSRPEAALTYTYMVDLEELGYFDSRPYRDCRLSFWGRADIANVAAQHHLG